MGFKPRRQCCNNTTVGFQQNIIDKYQQSAFQWLEWVKASSRTGRIMWWKHFNLLLNVGVTNDIHLHWLTNAGSLVNSLFRPVACFPFISLLKCSKGFFYCSTYVSDEVLQGGISDGDPIMGARPPSQFIQNDQRTLGRPGNDLWGFSQLLHERTASLEDVVWGSHPNKANIYTRVYEWRWTHSHSSPLAVWEQLRGHAKSFRHGWFIDDNVTDCVWF